jgi:DNA-binding NtrC family response regulator
LSKTRQLLIADEDPRTQKLCKSIAPRLGLKTVLAATSAEALVAVEERDVAVTVVGGHPHDEVLRLLRHIEQSHLSARTIVCARTAQVAAAVELVKAGAIDYLVKPFDRATLEGALQMALAAEKERARVVPFAEVERHAIERALAQAKGNKLLAARLLGIGKTTLYRKLSQYGGTADDPPPNLQTG